MLHLANIADEPLCGSRADRDHTTRDVDSVGCVACLRREVRDCRRVMGDAYQTIRRERGQSPYTGPDPTETGEG